jgi:hypothetical protein
MNHRNSVKYNELFKGLMQEYKDKIKIKYSHLNSEKFNLINSFN